MERNFKWQGLDLPEPDELELTDTERQTLREVAAEGGPLWKVMRFWVDYARKLEQDIANELVLTEEARLRVLGLQSLRNGIRFQYAKWEELLSLPETKETSQ